MKKLFYRLVTLTCGIASFLASVAMFGFAAVAFRTAHHWDIKAIWLDGWDLWKASVMKFGSFLIGLGSSAIALALVAGAIFSVAIVVMSASGGIRRDGK